MSTGSPRISRSILSIWRRTRPGLVLGVGTLVACASPQTPVAVEVPMGPPIEVMTAEGAVRGVTEGNLHIFKGLRYGAPVGGLERWQAPKPPAAHDGVFDARQFGPACEQTVAEIPKWMLTEAGEVALYEMTALDKFNAEEKSGDCLRLNIWTPKLPDPADAPADDVAPVADAPEAAAPVAADASADASAESANPASPDADASDGASDGASADAPVADTAVVEAPPAVAKAVGLPVIVHFHGGGLTSGSAVHPGQNGRVLAEKGVIVVTANYRLGSIGFLAGDGMFKDDTMAGNRGFMDAVRALEWVRDNIANFGGDPANVTLMGQSGGGTLVWSVLASPSSEGLVRRAIIMSGPIYDYPIEDHKKLTEAVLKKWNVPVGDDAALANVKSEDAISTTATTTLVGSKEFGSMSRTYLPAAGATGTPFLPDTILSAVEKGRLDNVDILIGSCNDDAKVSIIMVPLPNSFAIDIWNGYIGGLIADDDAGYEAMTNKYIAARPNLSETRAKEQLQTDALYRIRALKAAAIHSDRTKDESKGHTYAYQFNWESPTYKDDLGAMHGLDLIFSWGNVNPFPKALGHTNGKIDPSTQHLSDQMVMAWTNFAKTGNPTSELLPDWPEYDTDQRNTMVFNKESAAVSDPDGDLRKLWD